jgi:hypothetical protein
MALTTTMTGEEAIVYPSGSCYIGQTRTIEDGSVLKHGKGHLVSAAKIIHPVTGNHCPITEANASYAKWTEIDGEWCNDEPHGHCVFREHSGGADPVILYDGMWTMGVITPAHDPTKPVESTT